MACTVHIICGKWVIDGLWDSGCVVQGALPAVKQQKQLFAPTPTAKTAHLNVERAKRELLDHASSVL